MAGFSLLEDLAPRDSLWLQTMLVHDYRRVLLKDL